MSEPQGVSRRRLFGWIGAGTAGVLAAGAAGGAIGHSTAVDTAASSGPAPTDAVPFTGPHQAGIVTRPGRLHFVAFDVTTDDPRGAVPLLKAWTTAARRHRGPGRGSCWCGGRRAVRSAGRHRRGDRAARLRPDPDHRVRPDAVHRGRRHRPLRARRPPAGAPDRAAGLPRRPARPDDQRWRPVDRGLRERSAGGGDAVATWCGWRGRGQRPLVAARLRPHVLDQHRAGDPRNLFGFKDGTANLKAEDAADLDGYVGSRRRQRADWLAGGSYLVTRRIRMLIEPWDTATLDEQEQTIWRTKGAGAPLGQAASSTPRLHEAGRRAARGPGDLARLPRPPDELGDGDPAPRLQLRRRLRRPGQAGCGAFFIAISAIPDGFVAGPAHPADGRDERVHPAHVVCGVRLPARGARGDDWWGRLSSRAEREPRPRPVRRSGGAGTGGGKSPHHSLIRRIRRRVNGGRHAETLPPVGHCGGWGDPPGPRVGPESAARTGRQARSDLVVEPGRRAWATATKIHQLIAAGGMGQVWRGATSSAPLGRRRCCAASTPVTRPSSLAPARGEARRIAEPPDVAAVFDYGEEIAQDGTGETRPTSSWAGRGRPSPRLIAREGPLGATTDPRAVGADAFASPRRTAPACPPRRQAGQHPVRPDGSVKITDFGIAWSAAQRRPHRPGGIGTAAVPLARAGQGRPGRPGSDVYALG